MDSVLGRIYEHRKRDELKKALEKSLDEYLTENITATSTLASKFEECVAFDSSHGNIPKYVIDRYHHGNFPVRYMGVIHSPRQILTFQVEDMSKASCNNCSKRLRRFIYGILLPKNEGVLEWDREGGRLVEFTVQPVIVKSDGDRVPNLESLPEQNKDQRKDLLFSILESNESIQSLPEQVQLFAASISYWIRNARPKVTKDCVKILLLQYFQEKKYVPEPDQPKPRIDIALLHSLAQWQAVMAESLRLNQILLNAVPVPDLSKIFNGVTAQIINQELSKENPRKELITPTKELKRIYRAVKKGLGKYLLESTCTQ